MCFFNDTAPTQLYTLSLHDALPIFGPSDTLGSRSLPASIWVTRAAVGGTIGRPSVQPSLANRSKIASGSSRSEEHTSELQSLRHLVCRLLLEKKKQRNTQN